MRGEWGLFTYDSVLCPHKMDTLVDRRSGGRLGRPRRAALAFANLGLHIGLADCPPDNRRYHQNWILNIDCVTYSWYNEIVQRRDRKNPIPNLFSTLLLFLHETIIQLLSFST